jgi:two-component system, OmpR family, alkaline phosphatase synthesis response regulator PhoP
MENLKSKVLIIDDDKFLLNMYSIKFSKNNFEVSSATSGEEALNKLKDGYNPDIILLDIVMPVMDGFEILENIKKNNLAPKASVIMLTNQGQLADIERAKSLGTSGYIIKATTIPSEVVEEVTKIYNSRKNVIK